MYQRIVVALDGSALAEHILPHVEALAQEFGATLVLVRAIMSPQKLAALVEPEIGGVPMDPNMIEEIIESDEQEAADYLEQVARGLRQKGLTVETEHTEGRAAEIIVECAKRHSADLIGLTTHGRTGLGKLVFGSVADSVLKRTPTPVLLVRVHDPA